MLGEISVRYTRLLCEAVSVFKKIRHVGKA